MLTAPGRTLALQAYTGVALGAEEITRGGGRQALQYREWEMPTDSQQVIGLFKELCGLAGNRCPLLRDKQGLAQTPR